MSERQYAIHVGIKHGTLASYICKDKLKRKKLGASVGTKSLLEKKDQQLLVDSVIRNDRGCNGLGRAEVLDNIQDLNPSLSKSTANNVCPFLLYK
jgi:hypothetical protein